MKSHWDRLTQAWRDVVAETKIRVAENLPPRFRGLPRILGTNNATLRKRSRAIFGDGSLERVVLIKVTVHCT